ncbi:hypothetical protein AB1845_2563 [Acinetobacter baumannii]|nr:hypothetical protein AB1845_2563 [Acinetobacter baumannii]
MAEPITFPAEFSTITVAPASVKPLTALPSLDSILVKLAGGV